MMFFIQIAAAEDKAVKQPAAHLLCILLQPFSSDSWLHVGLWACQQLNYLALASVNQNVMHISIHFNRNVMKY